MILPLKTFILPSFLSINNFMKTNKIPININICCDIYSKKIIVEHKQNIGDLYILRIYEQSVLFNRWYSNLNSARFIAALDYSINKEHIKIEYMNINDIEYIGSKIYDEPKLTNFDSIRINKWLIDYIKTIAQDLNKEKVIVDVHYNLRIFNNYYLGEHFIATKRQCIDNPYWIEAEYIVKNVV
jgi:hypothetical protein